MQGKLFEAFFENVSRTLPVSLLAKDAKLGAAEKCLLVEDSLPVFDALDLLQENDCLVLKNGKIVNRNFLLKRPLRIAFFVILTEIESRLYRIQEWSNIPLKELNEKCLNDFIRCVVDKKELFDYQTEYAKRSDFKQDLKAVSSLRNLIVHVNKKLEMETDFETIIKRKKQMLKLLNALDQILAELFKRREQ